MRKLHTPNGVLELDDETPIKDFVGFAISAVETGEAKRRYVEVAEYEMAIAQQREWFADFLVVRTSLWGRHADDTESLLEFFWK